MKTYQVLLLLLIFTLSLIVLPDSILAQGSQNSSPRPSSNIGTSRKKGGRAAFVGGSFSLGFGVSLLTAEQNGLNNMIAFAKASAPGGGVTTGELNSGNEIIGQFTFHFANRFVALQFRPAYFTQAATGSGSDGSYNYTLTGFSFFPMIRIVPLSNDIIDFYLQAGLGYGQLQGDITNGPRNSSFIGSGFGTQIGLGADFCFFPEHCFGLEGNYRYLPVTRSIVRNSTSPAPYGASQSVSGRELEDLSANDVGTTMSGISANLNYTYHF